MPKHLHLDPFSGIAGDMALGALIHLGVDPKVIDEPLQKLGFEPGYKLTTQTVSRHGIGAIDLKVHIEQTAAAHEHKHEHTHTHEHAHSHSHGHSHSHDHTHAHDHDHQHSHSHTHEHHHRTAKDILHLIDHLDAPNRAKDRARAITRKLAEAEARVHGMTPEDVHFHEVGAVDSIVDMLGVALALEALDIDTLSCGPLPISRGYVRCAHGLMPVPAPATAYLLEGLPTLGVDRTGELITPTGAAIAAALCTHFGPTPPMTVTAVGYGAGDREDPKVPNLLRIYLGTT
ncbi:LarC family nickel insertion protein [Mucisphaera sp.]|uniref:LarC family nickel insertion protein n=1 Tax=Mucisphaera sp. TaxID=2913024 RepID=UPI003D0D2B48